MNWRGKQFQSYFFIYIWFISYGFHAIASRYDCIYDLRRDQRGRGSDHILSLSSRFAIPIPELQVSISEHNCSRSGRHWRVVNVLYMNNCLKKIRKQGGLPNKHWKRHMIWLFVQQTCRMVYKTMSIWNHIIVRIFTSWLQTEIQVFSFYGPEERDCESIASLRSQKWIYCFGNAPISPFSRELFWVGFWLSSDSQCLLPPSYSRDQGKTRPIYPTPVYSRYIHLKRRAT